MRKVKVRGGNKPPRHVYRNGVKEVKVDDLIFPVEVAADMTIYYTQSNGAKVKLTEENWYRMEPIIRKENPPKIVEKIS